MTSAGDLPAITVATDMTLTIPNCYVFVSILTVYFLRITTPHAFGARVNPGVTFPKKKKK